MPTIYVKLQRNDQMGMNDGPAGTKFVTGGFNYGIKTDRVHILRFSHIPVPKGSTITSATLYTVYSGKNQTGTAYTFTQHVYLDNQIPSKPLDPSRDEWQSAARTWIGETTSTWAWNQAGASRQIHSHNVKTHLDSSLANANWTLAGGSISFLLSHGPISNSDNIYLHQPVDSYPPVLAITYNEPASDGKDTVVNVQENSNLMNGTNSLNALSMYPYTFNNYFGTYVQPTYSYVTTPSAPKGGQCLRVQATTGKPSVILGLQTLEEGEWYNHSAYIYVPSSAPAGFSAGMNLMGDKGTRDLIGVRDTWVRQDIPFIMGTSMPWTEVRGDGVTTWNSSCEYYVANVQLTKGRLVRPYIDGSQALTNATYGWAGVNSNGFVRAAPPTITVDAQADKARRKYYAVNWAYANSAGHGQVLADIQVRKAAP